MTETPLELEQRLDENHFLIRFADLGGTYVLRLFPFAAFKLDGEFTVPDVLAQLPAPISNGESVGLGPGLIYQPLLVVTTACNLACSYCYAHRGSYGLKQANMSPKVVEQSIAFLRNRFASNVAQLKNYEQIEIAVVCFGGESLLNMPAILAAINSLKRVATELSDSFNLRIRPLVIINTNGLLLNPEVLEALAPDREMLELVISCDGLYHDEHRLTSAGRNTLQEVISRVREAQRRNFKVRITCCVMPEKLGMVKRNVAFLTELFGPEIEINLSFIRGAVPTVQERAIYPGQLQQAYRMEELARFGRDVADLIRGGCNLYADKIERLIRAGGFKHRCAACLYEFCVMPSGAVYPCHNFVSEDFCLGNIQHPEFQPEGRADIYGRFATRRTDCLAKCRDCSFQTICSGSFDCPSHSLFDLGDFNRVDEKTCIAGRFIIAAVLRRFLESTKVEL